MDAALGLEPTPEAYIAHLVLCFREIRRVLRDDGCCWAVMGDSYGATCRGSDLMLIPHRLALALQADGWTCRNDVVWAKKAPMPESVAGWRWERCRVKVAKSERAEGNYNAAAYGDSPQGAPKQEDIDGSATWTHDAEPVPGTVLDPFFGAGTTGLVADQLGLNCIGIELSEKYVDMSANRIEEDAGMFASVNTVT